MVHGLLPGNPQDQSGFILVGRCYLPFHCASISMGDAKAMVGKPALLRISQGQASNCTSVSHHHVLTIEGKESQLYLGTPLMKV